MECRLPVTFRRSFSKRRSQDFETKRLATIAVLFACTLPVESEIVQLELSFLRELAAALPLMLARRRKMDAAFA